VLSTTVPASGITQWLGSLGGLDNVKIGAREYNNGSTENYFDGTIDDFRYYNRAISLTEVLGLYNSAAGTEDRYPTLMNAISATQVYVRDVDYNAQGQTTRIVYGNGDVTTYSYYPDTLRLRNLLTINSQFAPIQDLSYTYDSVGNILTITDGVNTGTQNFQYDELNRLIQAQGTRYGSKIYRYDTIGNIIEKDNKTYSYGITVNGQFKKPHAVTSLSDGTTFGYDANGNMNQKIDVSRQLTEYSYDVENRLTQVTRNGVILANYVYDGDGGRVSKVVTQNGITTTTQFIGSLFETTSSTANTTIQNTRYIFLGDSRVASISGNQTLYYHDDHLGGTNVLTDSTGNLKEVIEYEPFGTESRHDRYGSSAEVALYYFTGQRKDDETGLYFYNARYYDPVLGRFIQADTIVQSPSNPQTLNRYTYCNNNPVNYTDPTGHWWWFVALIIKAAIAHPIIAAGIINATVNVATHASDIHSFGDFAKLAAVGYASGAIGAGTGIGVGGLVGGALGSFWGVVGGGVSGGLAGSFIGATGGALASGGDIRDAVGAWASSALLIAGTSAVLSAGAYGISKAVNTIGGAKAIQNATGSKTPVGQQGKGSKTSSLNVDKGGSASRSQALSNKGRISVDIVDAQGNILNPDPVVGKGTKLYRVWGDGAPADGRSWTNVDPGKVTNFRAEAGLPPQNSGRFVSEGTLIDTTGVAVKTADSIYGNPGGLSEVVVPDPNAQIQLERVSGVNSHH